MLTAPVKDHSVVRLFDGQEGTVVAVLGWPGNPLAYMLEVTETDEGVITVPHEDVAELLWEPGK